jgi:hypothetical protein
LLVVPAFSQSEPAADFRSIENSAFTVGEDLIYAVQFGRVSAGEARMHIPQIGLLSIARLLSPHL